MIKHVIFDLGQVLVKVDLQNFMAHFSKEFDITIFDLMQNQNDGAYQDFMIGNLTSEQFHQKTCHRYNHFVSLDRLKFVWDTMLTGPVDGMAKVVNQLHENGYSLALLSNTDPWHFEYCQQYLPFLEKFESRFLSYDLKMKKPDAEIFLTVANALHTKPEQCVFIDDVRENIDSARSLNFKTIHFQDANQLRQELTEMGIAM